MREGTHNDMMNKKSWLKCLMDGGPEKGATFGRLFYQLIDVIG